MFVVAFTLLVFPSNIHAAFSAVNYEWSALSAHCLIHCIYKRKSSLSCIKERTMYEPTAIHYDWSPPSFPLPSSILFLQNPEFGTSDAQAEAQQNIESLREEIRQFEVLTTKTEARLEALRGVGIDVSKWLQKAEDRSGSQELLSVGGEQGGREEEDGWSLKGRRTTCTSAGQLV